MGWELVKDSKNVKCWLNLDEINKCKSQFDWKNSVDKKIGIRYQWHYDEVEEKWFFIEEYLKENQYLILIDENKNEFKITTANLIYGYFGKIFNKRTDKFMYNIGDEINDLKIINKKYRKNKRGQNTKYYQYQCKKCGNIDWKCEGDLKRGRGCSVCSNRKIIKGVNDIATTNPELIKYFVNQEDAYKYSVSSGKKVLLQCLDCDHQKEMTIDTLYRQGFSCNKCGDGTSYPEKFMANVLFQLGIKFETQYKIKGYNQYSYDFYIPAINTLIETDGGQHFVDAFGNKAEKQQQIDGKKDDTASNNGFVLIRIDCRYSTMEWMKENITKEVGHIFDLSNVDWQKADLECQKSHMILACQLKRENPDLGTKEITELIKKEIGIKYDHTTIRNWLNRGNKLGLCHYNGKEEQIKNGKKTSGKNNPRAKKVYQVDLNGNIIKIWDYAKEISKELGYNYGTLMNHIKGRDKGKPYKGYIWEYCE